MNNEAMDLSNRHSLTTMLIITSEQNTQQDAIADLFIFLIRYSFLFNEPASEDKILKRDFSYFGELSSQNPNGARYLDPKYSRWISVDPALGEYIPAAGKGNSENAGNLPGMGGIYNHINGDLYHYAANNPVRYMDPDGRTDVYFIFTFDTNNMFAPEYRERNIEITNYIQNSMDNALKELYNHFVSYDIIEAADSFSISNAFSDSEVIMIILCGHGNDSAGISITPRGSSYTPSNIPDNISSSLGILILESCSQGAFISEWQERLGPDVKVFGWQEPVQVGEIGMFNRGEGEYSNGRNLDSYIREAIIRKWSNTPIDYVLQTSGEIYGE